MTPFFRFSASSRAAWFASGTLVLLGAFDLSGCVSQESEICESGLVCPPGSQCAAEQDICIQGSCGNGHEDTGEVCDDGNIIGGDNCSADCLSTEDCGNGVTDADEACDDGNTEGGDKCSADCFSTEVCGNGVIDEHVGEMCDDRNQLPGDGCSADCKSDEECGNNVTDPGEICDDGNEVNDDGCANDCQSTGLCGNGVPDYDRGEECDDNITSGNDDACVITLTGVRCKRAVCGDGWVWSTDGGDEECDGDGEGNGGETETCNANCTDIDCGDGIVNEAADEECDDGDRNGDYNFCADDCTDTGERCGDSDPNGPEVCDDGAESGQDPYGRCNDSCSGYLEYCGDTLTNGPEVCDEGTGTNGQPGHCRANCSGTCGDGTEQGSYEECDAGDENGEYGSGCDADCQDGGPRCNDHVLQTGDGETCELNGTYVDPKGDKCGDPVDIPSDSTAEANVDCTCRGDCTYCGDGDINGGNISANVPRETCDPPESDPDGDGTNCRHNCTYCGDGHRNGGEACDQGRNTGVNGACYPDCSGRCGDSVVHDGQGGRTDHGEECDDGDRDNGDGCDSNCQDETP